MPQHRGQVHLCLSAIWNCCDLETNTEVMGRNVVMKRLPNGDVTNHRGILNGQWVLGWLLSNVIFLFPSMMQSRVSGGSRLPDRSSLLILIFGPAAKRTHPSHHEQRCYSKVVAQNLFVTPKAKACANQLACRLRPHNYGCQPWFCKVHTVFQFAWWISSRLLLLILLTYLGQLTHCSFTFVYTQ